MTPLYCIFVEYGLILYVYLVISKLKQIIKIDDIMRFFLLQVQLFIMHPAQPSEARLGGVQFIFRHIQILTRLLQGELFGGYYVYCMHI